MLQRFYRLLTQPSYSIVEPDKRHQAQLLSSMIIIIFAILWTIEIATILSYAPSVEYTGYWSSICFSIILLAVYWMGRTRYYPAAVWLFILSLTAEIVYFGVVVEAEVVPSYFNYLLIPFMLAGFFLDERLTGILFFVFSISLALPVFLTKDLTIKYDMTDPLILFVTAGGLILVLSRYRNQLEEMRRNEIAHERNLLRTVIDNVPDQIFVRDRDSRFVLSNLSDARAMGVDNPSLLIGRNDFDFYPYDLAERFQADNAAVMKSGEPKINYEEASTITNGERRWVLTTKVPLRDLNGEVIGLVGIARDITERKKAENEMRVLERQLAHKHKLEALGQLAAGIAHEINTPAQYVASNLRFLRSNLDTLMSALARVHSLGAQVGQCPNCSQLLPQMEKILPGSKFAYLAEEFPRATEQSLQGIDRITEIISAMRIFSHPGGEKPTPTDINRILENTLTITQNQWKSVATVETHFEKDLPVADCYPAELGQAFLNIIVNATDAIAEQAGAQEDAKGLITVSTRQVDEWIEIQIADTGCGIPAEIQDRIYDYFFTTKDVGKGTGQGLAISHNVIVNMHAGSLAMESQEGQGATFTIRLPIARDITEKQ